MPDESSPKWTGLHRVRVGPGDPFGHLQRLDSNKDNLTLSIIHYITNTWTKLHTSSTDSPTRLACSMHESVSASYSYTAQLRSCFGCTLFDRLLLVQSMCTTRQQAPPASACRTKVSDSHLVDRSSGRRRSCRGGILLSCPVRAGFQLSTSSYHAWEARRVADNYYGPFLSSLFLCFFCHASLSSLFQTCSAL